LESFLLEKSGLKLNFIYMTYNMEARYLLKKKGRSCIDITKELRNIPVPSDWLEKLQEFENRYHGYIRNLQQYLASERYFKSMPRDIKMKQLYKMFIFFDSFFKQHRPFFMISNGPDHMAFWLSMDLLRYYGGYPCGFVSASWPGNHIIFFRAVGLNYWSRELYREYLKRGITEEEKKLACEKQEMLRNGAAVPYFIRSGIPKDMRKRYLWETIGRIINYIYWPIVERLRHEWYAKPIYLPGFSSLKKSKVKIKARLLDRYFDQMDWDAPFVFFPLHLEPEATILVHSNYYENQLEVIRALSKSLPVSWKLVVKDHPNMRGRRSWGFIREVRRFPNVVFIPNDIPSWKLIQKARLVAVLSGTAGLEACLLGRPVVAFGDPVWGYGPTFRKAGDLTRLSETLREVAALELPPEDERVQAFLLSWMHSTPPGVHDFNSYRYPVDDPTNVANIGQAISQLLHELRTTSRHAEDFGESMSPTP
jgi:hypothetical protein